MWEIGFQLAVDKCDQYHSHSDTTWYLGLLYSPMFGSKWKKLNRLTVAKCGKGMWHGVVHPVVCKILRVAIL